MDDGMYSAVIIEISGRLFCNWFPADLRGYALMVIMDDGKCNMDDGISQRTVVWAVKNKL